MQCKCIIKSQIKLRHCIFLYLSLDQGTGRIKGGLVDRAVVRDEVFADLSLVVGPGFVVARSYRSHSMDRRLQNDMSDASARQPSRVQVHFCNFCKFNNYTFKKYLGLKKNAF